MYGCTPYGYDEETVEMQNPEEYNDWLDCQEEMKTEDD